MRRLGIPAALIAATVLGLVLQSGVVARAGFFMGDFRAFYCAARVASHGADPYRTQPLRSCETAIGPKRFFEKNPGVTIPAPLPGYAIAALVPLAVLPFAVAATFWAVLLLLAWIACVAALARCAAVSWEIPLGAFALSLGALSLPFGEVVPLALALICIAAYCAWKGRHQAAALCAAGAMIEPHLALPICIALALWAPATRLPLALSLSALASLSLAMLGPAANFEYFTSVLPAHALSEVTRDTQYSVVAVLSAGGLAQTAALRAGTLWYLGTLGLGAVVAGMLARKTRNDAFLVCVPPAFAVFGGTFIHITQIAAALPAAVLLISYSTRRYRTLAIVALAMLAVPWGWVVSPALLVAPVFPVAFLAWRYWSSLRDALLAALAAAALLIGLVSLYTLAAPHFGAHAMVPAIDARLPEASWSAYSQKGSTGSLAAWAVRIPTWAGLALLLGLLGRATGIRLQLKVRPALIVTLAAACTLLPMAAQLYGDRAAGWLMVDFRAYYCAALAQRQGLNPYFVQPLHECERNTPAPYYRSPPDVTVPSPYPPYVLAMLAPLTLLPFESAAIVWWTLLALAIVVAARALARIGGLPVLIPWAALALSLGLTAFSSGNLMPLALAAILVGALCAARHRLDLAAVAIAVAMIEPHIALPAACALFVAYPKVRLVLASGVGVLVALSIITAGPAQSLAYVTSVLPAHALAEVSRDNQYSLAAVTASLGLPDGTAVLCGTISYLFMIALGVLVGLRLARRFDDPALALLVPPAFALLGGSFVHTVEIAAAVPAAVLLFTRAHAYRGWILGAVLLLAVPWMMATSAALFLAPLFPVAYLTYMLWSSSREIALRAAATSLAIITTLFIIASGAPVHAIFQIHSHPPIDPRLAEASWRQLVLGNSTNRPVMWLLRLPTWAGLATFAGAAVLLARKPHIMLVAESA